MDVMPNPRLCCLLLKILMGWDGVAGAKSLSNIGEGILPPQGEELSVQSLEMKGDRIWSTS